MTAKSPGERICQSNREQVPSMCEALCKCWLNKHSCLLPSRCLYPCRGNQQRTLHNEKVCKARKSKKAETQRVKVECSPLIVTKGEREHYSWKFLHCAVSSMNLLWYDTKSFPQFPWSMYFIPFSFSSWAPTRIFKCLNHALLTYTETLALLYHKNCLELLQPTDETLWVASFRNPS